MRFLLGVVVLVGCGGGGSNAPGPELDFDTRARACAIIGSCIGYDATECMALLDANATADQINCAVAATAADCVAVRGCFGQRLMPDPACVSGCSDGFTLVRCIEGMRLEQDCPKALESVGPACVTNGRSDCGGTSCTTDGELTCNGTTSIACDSGVTEVIDCGQIGLDCIPTSPRCAGALQSETCTLGTSPTCDGDIRVTCDGNVRRQDCKEFGGRTCVNGSCAFGAECDGPNTPNKCIGTVLEMCVAGLRQSIDCTTIGATSCVANRCR
jgi:hypothetical protein